MLPRIESSRNNNTVKVMGLVIALDYTKVNLQNGNTSLEFIFLNETNPQCPGL